MSDYILSSIEALVVSGIVSISALTLMLILSTLLNNPYLF